jgi:hypothetical protein
MEDEFDISSVICLLFPSSVGKTSHFAKSKVSYFHLNRQKLQFEHSKLFGPKFIFTVFARPGKKINIIQVLQCVVVSCWVLVPIIQSCSEVVSKIKKLDLSFTCDLSRFELNRRSNFQ